MPHEFEVGQTTERGSEDPGPDLDRYARDGRGDGPSRDDQGRTERGSKGGLAESAGKEETWWHSQEECS